MAEVKREIQLEIGHVLFVDIVGYSKLLINEQRALLDTLNQIIRNTDEFRSAEEQGAGLRFRPAMEWRWFFTTAPNQRWNAR